MSSVNVQGFIPGALCTYSIELRSTTDGTPNVGTVQPISADSKDVFVDINAFCIKSCVGDVTPPEVSLIGQKTHTLRSVRAYCNDTELIDGACFESMVVQANNSTAITVPLSDTTATLSGAGGTVTPFDLKFNNLQPQKIIDALQIVIVNYLFTLGYTPGTDYELTVAEVSPGKLCISFCNKHNPAGVWLGIPTPGDSFSYTLLLGEPVSFTESSDHFLIDEPDLFCCIKETICGNAVVKGTFNSKIVNADLSQFNQIVLTDEPARFFITENESITCDEVCLWMVHNCIEMCFTPSNVLNEPGTLAKLCLNVAEFTRMLVDTKIKINGVEFGFLDAADECLNAAQYTDGNDLANLTSMAAVMQSNYGLCKSVSVTIDGEMLCFEALTCNDNIDIDICGLDDGTGGLFDKEFDSKSTPANVKEPYKICATFKCKDQTFELEFFPEVIMSEDGCTVESVTICKDIDGILKSCLNTPVPECVAVDESNAAVFVDSMRCTVEFEFAEVYGTPLNQYNKRQGYSFVIYNGKYEPGDFGLFDVHCNSTPGLVQEFITIYEDGQKICQDACAFVYFDLDNSPSHTVTETITLYDAAGAPIFNHNFIAAEVKGEGTLQIAAGLAQLCDLLAAAGYAGTLEDIASYSITVNDGTTKSASIRFAVECCKKDREEFLFLTGQGTYQTLTTDGIINAQTSIVREFIKLCKPCQPGTQDKSRSVINSDTAMSFTVCIPKGCYTEKQICELTSTTDLYWLKDGKTYSVVPQTGGFVSYAGGDNTNIYFTFSIDKEHNFAQC